ncbi:MAG: hypothetical protein JWQ74_887 [Marmoricola sp.]|nr:hypothetical protein [Marmoricola sp.]
MGKRLVIESLEVRTATHSRTYEFQTGVNAITGPVGCGKSSMLELLKYGLGGTAKVMPAVRDNVTTIKVKFWAGEEHWEFTRALRDPIIQVFDLTTQESLGEWAATNRQNMTRVGPVLLDALGLPSNWRIPRSRKNPGEDTVPVSFWDVHKYLYLDQNRIDTSVIGHEDAALNNKRIAVFELIYGLADGRTVELATERGKRRAAAKALRDKAASVASFLQDMGDPDAGELAGKRAGIEAEIERAQQVLATARNDAQRGLVTTDALNAIGDARGRLDDLFSQRDALAASVNEAQSVVAQLNLEEQRIKRSSSVSASLSGLEFVQCPRCLQGLPDDRFDADHCHLCGQEQDVAEDAKPTDSLLKVVREQRKETLDLIEADQASLTTLSAQVEVAEEAVVSLLHQASGEEQRPSLPYLSALEEAASLLASAESALQRLDAAQERWATHAGLHTEADRLDGRAKEMAKEESDLKLVLSENTTRLTDLSQLFDEILRGLRDPWFNEAHVDTTDYLPIVDGEPFDMLAVGGGRKTIVNLAYHLANLYMSLSERGDMLLPTLLVVDSPRKNVGEGALDKAVVASIYTRLETLQNASRDEFQIIFADNDMPTAATQWVSKHITLDYDNPLVPGVDHRGQEEPTDPNAAEEIE